MSTYTLKNFGTLSGNAAATMMVVNVVQHISGWGERWFGLFVAVAVSMISALMTKAPKNFGFFGVAVLHGFLTYATAFGVQNSVVVEDKPETAVAATTHVPVPPPHSTIFFTRPEPPVPMAAPPPPPPPPVEQKSFRSGW